MIIFKPIKIAPANAASNTSGLSVGIARIKKIENTPINNSDRGLSFFTKLALDWRLILLWRLILVGGIVVFCGMFGIFSSPAYSQANTTSSEAPYIQERPLIIGVYTWAPYVGYELLSHGLLTEVIQIAMKRAGIATEVKNVPWSRALKETIRGKIDIIPGLWYQEERVKAIAFGSVLAENRMVLISRSHREKRIEILGDLDNLLVGVARDYAYPKVFLEAQNFQRDFSKNLEVILTKLVNGRVDAALADELVARHTANSLFTSAGLFDYAAEPLEVKNLFIGISRKTPGFREVLFLFGKALDEMKADGSYQDLLEKHGLTDQESSS